MTQWKSRGCAATAVAVVVVTALGLGARPVRAQAPAGSQGSVAGSWEISLTTPQGITTANVTITQDGDKITGALESPIGTVPVTGTVVGNAVVLSVAVELQGMSLRIGLNGKLDGESLSGTVAFGDLGELPFTGKRLPPRAAAAATAAVAPAARPAPSPAGSDANGRWDVVLTVAGAGQMTMTADLEQNGSRVTGTFRGAEGGGAVNGTMTGTSLVLQFDMDTPHGTVPIAITGELGPAGFVGKATVAGVAEADWTATRGR